MFWEHGDLGGIRQGHVLAPFDNFPPPFTILMSEPGAIPACLICYVGLDKYSTLTLGRKLARLRAQLLEPAPGAGSGTGAGFDVSKSGDARIALVGFPSVGKSTFLSKITKT